MPAPERRDLWNASIVTCKKCKQDTDWSGVCHHCNIITPNENNDIMGSTNDGFWYPCAKCDNRRYQGNRLGSQPHRCPSTLTPDERLTKIEIWMEEREEIDKKLKRMLDVMTGEEG